MAKNKNGSSLEKKGAIVRAMDAVERVGNALPNPATIFLILTLAVIIISAICGSLGVSVTYETIDTANGNAIVEKTVNAVNLLTPDSIRHLVTTVVSSFTGFFALGTVFTIMIGVGVADGRHDLCHAEKSRKLRPKNTGYRHGRIPWHYVQHRFLHRLRGAGPAGRDPLYGLRAASDRWPGSGFCRCFRRLERQPSDRYQ